MKTRALTCVLTLCLVTLADTAARAATVTLKNDAWTGSSASMAVQGGFIAKEGFASVFIPPICPFKVTKIQVYIAPGPGGSPSTKMFTVQIYNDTPVAKLAARLQGVSDAWAVDRAVQIARARIEAAGAVEEFPV